MTPHSFSHSYVPRDCYTQSTQTAKVGKHQHRGIMPECVLKAQHWVTSRCSSSHYPSSTTRHAVGSASCEPVKRGRSSLWLDHYSVGIKCWFGRFARIHHLHNLHHPKPGVRSGPWPAHPCNSDSGKKHERIIN